MGILTYGTLLGGFVSEKWLRAPEPTDDVSTRLSLDSSKYTQSNLSEFSFQLSKDDHALIAGAQENLRDIPGDCGDEYRRPPFLTATGDLSHHLVENNKLLAVEKAVAQGKRIEDCSGSKWEPIAVSEIVLLSLGICPLTLPLTKHHRVIAVRYALATQSAFQAPQQTRPSPPSQSSAALHHRAKP